MNPIDARLAFAGVALAAAAAFALSVEQGLAEHPLTTRAVPERRVVLIVDAAAGQARRTLQAALGAAGVACVDAGALVEELGRKTLSDTHTPALLGGLAAACAVADGASAVSQPVVAVFLSAVAFRGLGRALLQHLPLV